MGKGPENQDPKDIPGKGKSEGVDEKKGKDTEKGSSKPNDVGNESPGTGTTAVFEAMLDGATLGGRTGVAETLAESLSSNPQVNGVFDTRLRGVDIPGMVPEYIEAFKDDPEIMATCSGIPAMAINSTIMMGKPLINARIQTPPGTYMSVYDVGGSTNIFEKLENPKCDPKKYADFISTYQRIHHKITAVAEEYGGDVLQFQGDAQIIIFPSEAAAKESSKKTRKETEQDIKRLQKLLVQYNMEQEGKHNPDEVCGLRNVICDGSGLTFQIKKSLKVRIEPGEVMDRVKEAEGFAKGKEKLMSPEERNAMHAFEYRTGQFDSFEEIDISSEPMSPHLHETGLVIHRDYAPIDEGAWEGLKQRILTEVPEATGAISGVDQGALGSTYAGVGVPMFINIARRNGKPLPPAELEAVQETVVQLVEREGGYVNKDINGEGILVAFGAGLDMEQQDPVERGVRTAAMIKAYTQQEGRAEPIAVGIAVGRKQQVVRMVVGTPRRNETTIMGTIVNRTARTGAEASRLVEENGGNTVILVGATLDAIGHLCEGREFKHAAKGVPGGLNAVEVTKVKDPQDALFFDEITQSLQVVEGQEEPYERFLEMMRDRPIVRVSGASSAVQEIFIKMAARDADRASVCILRPEVVDQFTEFRALVKIMKSFSEQFGASVFEYQGETRTDVIALTTAITQGNIEEVKKLLPGLLERICVQIGKPLHICVLEGDSIDASSTEVLEDAVKKLGKDHQIKFVLAGKEIERADMSTNEADSITKNGAKGIVDFMLRERAGIETNNEVIEETSLERLIAILAQVGGEKAEQVEVVNIRPIVTSLIFNGDLYQEGRVWKLRDQVSISFNNQAEIFDSLIGPLVRKLGGAKGERLRNFALCFAVAKEPINFEHIPKQFQQDEDEWEEFTTLLASRGILKAAHIPEGEFTIHREGAFQLAGKLQDAAEACLRASNDTKAGVHILMARQHRTQFLIHNGEKIEQPNPALAEAVNETKTRRRHFLDHYGKYLEVADPTHIRMKEAGEYLRLLIHDIQADFERNDFTAVRRKTKLLAEVVHIFAGPSETGSTEAHTKKLYLEAVSRLMRASYRERAGLEMLEALLEEGGVLDVEVGSPEEDPERTVKLLTGLRIIAMRIENVANEVVHTLGSKEAKRVGKERNTLARLREQMVKFKEVTQRYGKGTGAGTNLMYMHRMVSVLQLYTEVPRMYATALKKLGQTEAAERYMEAAERRQPRVVKQIEQIEKHAEMAERKMGAARAKKVVTAMKAAADRTLTDIRDYRAGLNVDEVLTLKKSQKPTGEKRKLAAGKTLKGFSNDIVNFMKKGGVTDLENAQTLMVIDAMTREEDPYIQELIAKATEEVGEIERTRQAGREIIKPSLGPLGNLSHFLRILGRAHFIIFGQAEGYENLSRKARLCAEAASALNKATGEPMYEWAWRLRCNAAEAAIEEGNQEAFERNLASVNELKTLAPKNKQADLEEKIERIHKLAEIAEMTVPQTA